MTFAVTAQGTPPLAYQWFHDGVGLAGATNDSLSLPSVQPAQAGDYTVEVRNDAGAVLSSAATLVLKQAH